MERIGTIKEYWKLDWTCAASYISRSRAIWESCGAELEWIQKEKYSSLCGVTFQIYLLCTGTCEHLLTYMYSNTNKTTSLWTAHLPTTPLTGFPSLYTLLSYTSINNLDKQLEYLVYFFPNGSRHHITSYSYNTRII